MNISRKSSLTIELQPVMEGCAPTIKLTVSTPRKTKDDYVIDSCIYAFARIPCDIGGIGVRLDRLDLDRPETYHVRYINPDQIECDCIAGSKGVRCKHCDAVQYLMDQGELA